MSSVDEVFRQMQAEQNEVSMLSDEETIDSNDYCMLESDTTRKILIPEKYSIFGVESDEYAKTVKFAFPRYVDDGKLDLSEYSIRINYMTANPDTENNKDQIQAKNVHVVDDYVVFEWELSRRVTQYRGTITFIVCAVTANDNGTITTEWNTTIATSQSIEGLEVSPNENEEEQARDLLTELLANLNNSKNDAIADITQTKTQAISDIEAEGQTQTSAVDAKGAQVLESIPDDYTTLENRVDELERNRAYVIVGNGSGEFVTLNDSSELKTRNVKLFGKSVQAETTGVQLFNVNVCKNETDLQYKITIDDYETGKITVSMDNPEGAVAMPVNRLSDYCPTMTAGKTYYLSGKHDGSSNGDIRLVDVSDTWDFGTSREIAEQDLQSAVKFGFGTYSNIMIVEGTTKKAYEVYTGGEAATEPTPEYPLPITSAGNYDAEAEKYEIGIGVTGKNLFNASKVPTKTQSGATVTNNGDGSFTISGKLSDEFGDNYKISHNDMVKFFKIGTVKMYTEKTTHPYFYVNLFKDNKYIKTLIASSYGATGQFEMEKEYFKDEAYYLVLGINGNNNAVIVPGTIKPVLYQEGDSTWEPFKQQLSTLQIPNPFRGIPVDSGGNYTDADGQQWLCDYIDRERGKYVQCVQEIVSNNSENWGRQAPNHSKIINFFYALRDKIGKPVNVFCNIAKYKKEIIVGADNDNVSNVCKISNNGVNFLIDFTLSTFPTASDFYDFISKNPIIIYYLLETPIETDLTPDQLAALDLSTYQGITNIGTDTMPQVGVEVEYIADTKIYIDNVIAEAIAAIPTEQGGNEL